MSANGLIKAADKDGGREVFSMSDTPKDESDVTKDAAVDESDVAKGAAATESKITKEAAVDKTKITKEAAVAALHENRQARVVAVEQGISALLAEHNCVLDVQMIFSIYREPIGKVMVMPRD